MARRLAKHLSLTYPAVGLDYVRLTQSLVWGNSSTQPEKQNYDEPLKHEAYSSPGVRPAPRVYCIGRVVLPVGPVARAQERTAQSIVDGVVNAVCQKQIVLLGELPTHGEAHTFPWADPVVKSRLGQRTRR